MDQPAEEGWELGVDVAYLRELCEHWAGEYDFERLPLALNEHGSCRWEGVHFLRAGEGGRPLVLVHGWPTGPILYLALVPRLLEAGYEVIVPSLPGFGWSDDPGRPLNVVAVAKRIAAVAEDGLGHERYAVAGGDWGAPIATRIAFDRPGRVTALHVYTPATLPTPGNLTDPPLSDAERQFIEEGTRWRHRQGHHLLIQSAAPDIVGVGLTDSPAGLAAYLVEKYRSWSGCDELERCFSKDALCDFLTMYWVTGTIGSSMRLYLGERRDRWRPGPDETIDVPSAVASFPDDIVRNPPREWAMRLLSDLRRWTEMPTGGHFAPIEQPELLADDLIAFLETAFGG